MPSPGVELLPAGHDVHHATPASEYVPEAQLKQSYHPPSELYLPASQVTHEELSKLELRGTLELGSQKWHVPVSGGGCSGATMRQSSPIPKENAISDIDAPVASVP